jgi:phosphosulfolactate phosphohydrolase-like enzyme
MRYEELATSKHGLETCFILSTAYTNGGKNVERRKKVTIDAFPQSAFRHLERDAIVCIDVVQTTTALVTSVSQGRPTYSAPDFVTALEFARSLDSALLAAETDEEVPEGFSIRNSLSEIMNRDYSWRPLVLVSKSGTPLITNSAECPAVYIASFQNLSATAKYVALRHDRIALLSAGTDCQVCCEDQMAAAWIAEKLVEQGFESEDMGTSEAIKRWSGIDVSLVSWGNSAARLRSCGQEKDLEFLLGHVDDLDIVCYYEGGQIKAPVGRAWHESRLSNFGLVRSTG